MSFLRGERATQIAFFFRAEVDLQLMRALMSKLAAYGWNRSQLMVQAPSLTH